MDVFIMEREGAMGLFGYWGAYGSLKAALEALQLKGYVALKNDNTKNIEFVEELPEGPIWIFKVTRSDDSKTLFKVTQEMICGKFDIPGNRRV